MEPESATFPVRGVVLTPAFNPVPGVFMTVYVEVGNNTAALHLDRTTDAGGAFSIDVPPGTHRIEFVKDGYFRTNETVTVIDAPVDLAVTLVPDRGPTPFVEQFPFTGYVECAMEALIITPSCDTILAFAGAPQVFQDDSVMEFVVRDGWVTTVLDVSFDASSHPGIAGMRASLYADNGSAELTDYQRIAQANGPEPFTLRVDAGEDYGQALPAPIGRAELRTEFFPHGHADDTICDPVVLQACFLGVGTTARLEFEAIATVFYHEAAPDGWTLLA